MSLSAHPSSSRVHLKFSPTQRKSSCGLAVPQGVKELRWEAGTAPAAPAGISLPPAPLSSVFPGLWHSKTRQKVSYLSSFLVLVVNALENLPTWLVLRVSSTRAISNPDPSRY